MEKTTTQTPPVNKVKKTVVTTSSQRLGHGAGKSGTHKSSAVVTSRVSSGPKVTIPARRISHNKPIVIAAKKVVSPNISVPKAVETTAKRVEKAQVNGNKSGSIDVEHMTAKHPVAGADKKGVGSSDQLQQESRFAIELRCPTLSRTCPIWTLDKCIPQCPIPDPPASRDCNDEFVLCGYAGDRLAVTYEYTAEKLAAGSLFFSSGVVFTNNATFSVWISPPFIRPEDSTATVGINLNTNFSAPTQLIPAGEKFAFNVVGLLPEGLTCEDLNAREVAIQVGYGFETFEYVYDAIEIACDEDLLCPCNDVNLQITDEQGGVVIFISDEIPATTPIGTPVPFTNTPEAFLVGSVGNNKQVSCNGQQEIINEATLASIPPTEPVCGPTVCPATANATVTINCVFPEVTANGTVTTTTQESWCVCKKGEFIGACDPPGIQCVRSQGYYRTHGPTGAGCEGCNPSGQADNAYPASLAVEGLPITHPNLTQGEACALIQANMGERWTCITDCSLPPGPLRGKWARILAALRQYIAFLLNVQKIGGAVPSCINGVYDEMAEDLIPFFATYANGKYTLACDSFPFDDATLDTIDTNAEILEKFNTGRYAGCLPNYAACSDGSALTTRENDEPCCDFPLVKWTTDLSRTVTTTTSTSLEVTICLPEEPCTPAYEKTFTVRVYALPRTNGDIPLATKTIIIPANSVVDRCFSRQFTEIDLPTVEVNDEVAIVVTTTQDTYATATCGVIEEGEEVVVANLTETFTAEQTALTTSEITDTITFPGCTPTPDPSLRVVLPPCSDPTDCQRFIINDTTFTATASSDCGVTTDITFSICSPFRGNQFREFLEDLVRNNQTLSVNNFLALLENPECYNAFEFTFYTEVPPCADSVSNEIRINTIGPGESSRSSSSTPIVAIPQNR